MKKKFFFISLLVIHLTCKAQHIQVAKLSVTKELELYMVKLDSIYKDLNPPVFYLHFTFKDSVKETFDIRISPSFNKEDEVPILYYNSYFYFKSKLILVRREDIPEKVSFPDLLSIDKFILLNSYKNNFFIKPKATYYYLLSYNDDKVKRGLFRQCSNGDCDLFYPIN